MKDNNDWMDLKQAAKYLGVYFKTVEKKARQGIIKYGKAGREYRFKREWLEDYILSNGQN